MQCSNLWRGPRMRISGRPLYRIAARNVRDRVVRALRWADPARLSPHVAASAAIALLVTITAAVGVLTEQHPATASTEVTIAERLVAPQDQPVSTTVTQIQPAPVSAAAAGAVQDRAAPVIPAFVPATDGNWNPKVGVAIAQRALAWLSWPYSYDGGDAEGPTRGTAVDYDSRNDGSITGFDCSGLVLFAIAPWRSLAHSAAAQYSEAGAFHPALNALQPGDLVFWSPTPFIKDISHVAVYIGDGNVVQAPHSGALITVTPLYDVERAYMGATRPLT